MVRVDLLLPVLALHTGLLVTPEARPAQRPPLLIRPLADEPFPFLPLCPNLPYLCHLLAGTAFSKPLCLLRHTQQLPKGAYQMAHQSKKTRLGEGRALCPAHGALAVAVLSVATAKILPPPSPRSKTTAPGNQAPFGS